MQSSHMKTSQPNKPRKFFSFPINHRELTCWVNLEKKMVWLKQKKNVVNRVNQATNLVICTEGFFEVLNISIVMNF